MCVCGGDVNGKGLSPFHDAFLSMMMIERGVSPFWSGVVITLGIDRQRRLLCIISSQPNLKQISTVFPSPRWMESQHKYLSD